jgi:hypothetical protein
MKKYIVGLLFTSVLLYIYVRSPIVFDAVALTFIPLLLVAIIQAKRTNVYSQKKLSITTCLKANSLSIVSSLVMPGKSSELIRPLYFLKRRKMPFSEGAIIVIIERFYDVMSFFILTPIVLSLFWRDIETGINKYLLMLFGVILFSGVTFFLIFEKLALRLIACLPFENIKNIVKDSYINFGLAIKRSLSFTQFFLTILVWFLSWMLYWLFFSFNGGPIISLNQSLYIFLIATLGMSISITPSGLGSFEAIMVFTLKSMGYKTDLALASAFGLRLMTFLPSFLIVLYALATEPLAIFNLKVTDQNG